MANARGNSLQLLQVAGLRAHSTRSVYRCRRRYSLWLSPRGVSVMEEEERRLLVAACICCVKDPLRRLPPLPATGDTNAGP
jgi:hypothetical protein